jgi:hypothetical protein
MSLPPRCRASVHLLRPGVLLALAEAERLRHVADGVLRPVADDVRHLRGIAAAVLLVDVLDDLLAPVGIEVDIDVRLLLAQAGEETFEGEAVEDRVDRRDAERVADRRVRGRAAPLAEDAATLREGDDVVHDEEVAGEVLRLDHPEFLLEALMDGCIGPGILLERAAPHELAQPRHGGVALRHLLLRQPGPCGPEWERELLGELDRAGDGTGVAREPLRHLGPAPQVGAIARRQPGIHVVEAAPGPHGGDGGGERMLLRRRVVHRIRRDGRQAAPGREPREGVVVLRVEGPAVVEELHDDVLVPEAGDEPVELVRRPRLTPGDEGLPHGALAASGEHDPVAVGRGRELVEVVDGAPLLRLGGELRGRDGAGEPVVALLAPGQHDQVVALRVGVAVLGRAEAERELGAEHGREAGALGGLREAHDAVEAVMVGEGEPVEPEPHGLVDELLGRGDPVEEAEVGVHVEFGVGDPWFGRAWRIRAGGCSRLQAPHWQVVAAGARRRGRARARPRSPAGCSSPCLIPPLACDRCRVSRSGPRPPSAAVRAAATSRLRARRRPGSGRGAAPARGPTSAAGWAMAPPTP